MGTRADTEVFLTEVVVRDVTWLAVVLTLVADLTDDVLVLDVVVAALLAPGFAVAAAVLDGAATVVCEFAAMSCAVMQQKTIPLILNQRYIRKSPLLNEGLTPGQVYGYFNSLPSGRVKIMIFTCVRL